MDGPYGEAPERARVRLTGAEHPGGVRERRRSRAEREGRRQRADDRLPPPGTIITRPYKGAVLHVKVLAKGFEYEGNEYHSLSAVAKAITGSHCNGFLFFRMSGKGAKS